MEQSYCCITNPNLEISLGLVIQFLQLANSRTLLMITINCKYHILIDHSALLDNTIINITLVCKQPTKSELTFPHSQITKKASLYERKA